MRIRALSAIVCVCLLGCGGPSTSDGETDADGGSTGSESGESGESGTDTDTGTETDETETGETGDPPGNLLLSDEVLNIAHRGGSRLRPEATLVAFDNALAVGADVLEFDVHASSDGVIVIMHDATVDRTTDGTGAVADMTFDELRTLDAGYEFTPDGGQTFPYRGMGIQIPTPQEVFDTFPDRYYLIEIKQSEPSIAADLVDIIAEYAVEERVVIASFQQVAIDEVRAANPELFTALTGAEMIDLLTNGDSPDYEPPALFVQTPWDVTDQALVDLAHELGLKVHPWTVNSEGLMHDLIDRGVDGIMTDDPMLLDMALGG